MERTKAILLIFPGAPIQQEESIYEIENGYECWNLKKFSIDDFINKLKNKIPPVNENVLGNYKVKADNHGYGISEAYFKNCSWWLLVPDSLPDTIISSPREILFLLNLYSPKFLDPLFYASDFGILPLFNWTPDYSRFHWVNEVDIFKRPEFIEFFKKMLPQAQYWDWNTDRDIRWTKENWRLYTAWLLYSGLIEYDQWKSTIGWQRESADMSTILESLFTAGDIKNEEVGYRLRKRVASLIAWKMPDIENEIKNLYSDRSAFVHGSLFVKVAKDKKRKEFPLLDFNLLHKHRECVRLAFIAYLNLAMDLENNPKKYNNINCVMDILEQSIIDINLRTVVIKETQELFKLIPFLK